jgi:ABC-type sugar transport system ATPase subunit
VRPEDLRVVSGGELAATVELVSPQGAEQFVNTRIDGVEIMLRLDNHQKVAARDMLSLGIDRTLLHVFDRKTGESLTSTAAAPAGASVTLFPPQAHRR